MAASNFVDYDKIFLFGDSITERAYDQTNGFALAAALQNTYGRRLDVVGRGFSGYNTAHAVYVLPSIVPPVQHSRIRLMTIFFGANDAVFEGQAQHVALSEYRENLKKIVENPTLKEHGTKFILIIPPPICAHQTWRQDLERGRTMRQRTAENTKRYADAAVEVAAELGVPIVNTWQKFMEYAGWLPGNPLVGSSELPENEKLAELLCDGLHFTPKGYQILYEALLETINTQFPELAAEKIPYLFPEYGVAPR